MPPLGVARPPFTPVLPGSTIRAPFAGFKSYFGVTFPPPRPPGSCLLARAGADESARAIAKIRYERILIWRSYNFAPRIKNEFSAGVSQLRSSARQKILWQHYCR